LQNKRLTGIHAVNSELESKIQIDKKKLCYNIWHFAMETLPPENIPSASGE